MKKKKSFSAECAVKAPAVLGAEAQQQKLKFSGGEISPTRSEGQAVGPLRFGKSACPLGVSAQPTSSRTQRKSKRTEVALNVCLVKLETI